MPKQQIRTARVAAPSAHFSQAIAVDATGKLVFVSGMTARRPDGTIAGIGDIEEQTRQVCENIKHALDGELYFYSRIFGFALAEPVEPVEIENL